MENIRIAKSLISMAKELMASGLELDAKYRGWLRCLDNVRRSTGDGSYVYKVNVQCEDDGEYDIDLKKLANELNKLGYGNVATVANGLIKIVDPVNKMLEDEGLLQK